MSDNPNNPYSGTPNEPLEGGNTPPPPPLFNEPPPAYEPPPVPPQSAYAPPPPHHPGSPTKEERNWAMFAHLSAIAVALIGSATSLPAFGFIGPLVIYLMKKDESPFIADQAKEALNFNITVGLAMLAMWLLAFVLIWTIVVPFLMAIAMVIVGIAALVFTIIASIKASEGQFYRYPLTIRLVK